ncbi:UDP-2,4-diacetamido-2,4,6-trideoxy-beta-L-altropyranose hydrolase [Cohnella nanjingensis]|uniref:UDP-2,4-diacetamido-2,4, 6-trideoxy-beta-L-altropyranose hydrolase n=1 Tax=Cohnella nanjingensis TaxID=1387779 RepID=A0A7X0VGI4_9BACL|nr:UDP-2,4-diacetamido-2,4,6-trideoxy-beta-L-altropyranose hydrolase [Cohnella nanjingensis]MBB6671694.1 UDP-2,4-diacetamido-2,4,6-trideoxy-beta-L-altropyranose hydrolase [Cohnella nanjingensis]
MIRIAIRADASLQIGTGHVMRCLTLADALRRSGTADVAFVCRELTGNLIPYIRDRGYPVHALPPAADLGAAVRSEAGLPPHAGWLEASWREDAAQTIACLLAQAERPDWLVVDHYALDRRYESALRPYAGGVMAIDDLADRPHDADLLLDQNLSDRPEARYASRVDAGTRLLLGPRYALLREAFAERRPTVRRGGKAERLLVSFGGADRTGETLKALAALEPMAEAGARLTVLAGQLNPMRERIERLCGRLPQTRFIAHTEDVAALMAEHDLAVGSGGSTTWERGCLGLPAVIVATADNQVALAEQAAQAGMIAYLGFASDVSERRLREAVRRLAEDEDALRRMSDAGMAAVDGLGAAAVAKEMRAWAESRK